MKNRMSIGELGPVVIAVPETDIGFEVLKIH
jgi:hypothetical protein